MFKKLKEKIESGEDGSLEKGPLSSVRRPPGLAMRTVVPVDTGHDSEKKPLPVLEEHKEQPSLNSNQIAKDIASNEIITQSESNNSIESQSVLVQLRSELVSLRREHDKVITEKDEKERELMEEIHQLKLTLQEKQSICDKMEGKVKELTWSVDNLTSRLLLYSNHKDNELVEQLQKQVTELELALRQRDIDIEIYETRLSAQSKQYQNVHQASLKKSHNFQDTINTLQTSLHEKDTKLSQLNIELIKIRSQLSDVEKRRQELDRQIDDKNKRLEDKNKEFECQVLTHSEELDKLKSEHKVTINELETQIQTVKDELKDKENKLERLVTELPDQPVVNTVLDGYSKLHITDSFLLPTLHTPGGVYRKEVEPLSRHTHHIPDDMKQEESPPALLPIENHTHSKNDGFHFDQQHYDELVELRKYNQSLEEDLAEKNKTIRLQQQKLLDMKKTLNKELKPLEIQPAPPPLPQPPPAFLTNSSWGPPPQDHKYNITSDINFQYLKNVVLRFLCSREDEALQLVKAVSTLLKLSKDEERYMKEFLNYKMSWFGTMPLPPNTPTKLQAVAVKK